MVQFKLNYLKRVQFAFDAVIYKIKLLQSSRPSNELLKRADAKMFLHWTSFCKSMFPLTVENQIKAFLGVECYCFIPSSSSFAFSLKHFAALNPLFLTRSLIVKPRSATSYIKNAIFDIMKTFPAHLPAVVDPALVPACATSSATCIPAFPACATSSVTCINVFPAPCAPTFVAAFVPALQATAAADSFFIISIEIP